MSTDDDLPDVRDGLTRKERIVLVALQALQRESAGRALHLPQLYGRVLEQVDLSREELQAIVKRLAGR